MVKELEVPGNQDMNKMLKLAYDHGRLLAVKEFEKLAAGLIDPALIAKAQAALARRAANTDRIGKLFKEPVENMGFFERMNFKSPFMMPGMRYGALSGGVGGFMNSEDGQGFKGFLSGAAGGGLLGGAMGRYGGRMLMGDKTYSKAINTHRQNILGEALAKTNPAMSKKLINMAGKTMKNPGYAAGFQTGERGMDAAALGAGLVGGLGAGSLAGANDNRSFFG